MSSWLKVIRSDWDALRAIELTQRSAEDQIEDKAVIDAMRRFEEDDDYPIPAPGPVGVPPVIPGPVGVPPPVVQPAPAPALPMQFPPAPACWNLTGIGSASPRVRPASHRRSHHQVDYIRIYT